jgi:hypothetical protein
MTETFSASAAVIVLSGRFFMTVLQDQNDCR